MSGRLVPRAHLLASLVLAALVGCQETTDAPVGPQPQFAQGDNGTWTVNSLADPGDGVCDDAECTLREAIDDAGSGHKIGFASGLQGEIQLTVGELTIDGKVLTIDGDGRIALNAHGDSRIMQVLGGGGGPSSDVSLLGLTLANGFVPAGDGGGLFVAGSVVLALDGVTLSNNRSLRRGGGAFLGGNQTGIRNSTISGNTADGDGGGIYFGLGTSLTLIESSVDNNSAEGGGGLFIAGGEVAIRGTTFSGNAASFGGAISNGDGLGTPGGLLTIRSSTLTKNVGAAYGGGLVHGGGSARTSLVNSIVAGNTRDDCRSLSGGFSSLGHNLGGCLLFTGEGDVLVQPAQVFTEVLEADLGDNGGPTRTHALIARGRAADAGYCPGETTDQRGFARPVDDPGIANARDACDIGAYELQGPVAAVADLMISQAVNKTSVKQGELLTYSVRVQNLGPETAPNVVVTDLLPNGATFVEARHNKGTHTAPPKGETGTVTWSVGDMLDQANEVAEITVTVLVKGRTTITNTASVAGDVADPNEANNSAAIKVSVASGSGGKSGGKKS